MLASSYNHMEYIPIIVWAAEHGVVFTTITGIAKGDFLLCARVLACVGAGV